MNATQKVSATLTPEQHAAIAAILDSVKLPEVQEEPSIFENMLNVFKRFKQSNVPSAF